eukprot:9498480-Pyramimonas_sp.AAC.2
MLLATSGVRHNSHRILHIRHCTGRLAFKLRAIPPGPPCGSLNSRGVAYCTAESCLEALELAYRSLLFEPIGVSVKSSQRDF